MATISITLKTPDAVDNAIERYVGDIPETEDNLELKYRHLQKLASKYFKYGETVTILLDTETGKATVKEVNGN